MRKIKYMWLDRSPQKIAFTTSQGMFGNGVIFAFILQQERWVRRRFWIICVTSGLTHACVNSSKVVGTLLESFNRP